VGESREEASVPVRKRKPSSSETPMREDKDAGGGARGIAETRGAGRHERDARA
jgi:hypothetical protein